MNFKKRVNGSWVDVPHYVSGTGTETITTLPATIYPLAQTATIELKGNTVQSGTPTPDSPIMPDGTGDKTANWFDISNVTHQTLSPDGTISTESAMDLSGFIEVNGDFTVSWTAVRTGAYMRVSTYDTNKNYIERLVAMNTYTNTHYSNSHIGYIRINYENSYGLSKIMLNSGSTALPFQPYGYKIPISSGDTTTPVYLGEVQTTRKIKKYEFTGTENISSNTLGVSKVGFTIVISDMLSNGRKNGYCTHFVAQNSPSRSSLDGITYGANDKVLYVTFSVATATAYNLTDVASIKTWLQQQYAAGTPVTVWYVLATPTTGIVNEPLRKIGDYADEVSGITIPTIAGANTLSVGTTLQPSEVTVNYKGWHPAIAHERTNGAWT